MGAGGGLISTEAFQSTGYTAELIRVQKTQSRIYSILKLQSVVKKKLNSFQDILEEARSIF